MSFYKLKSGNSLFLICPTDHIESVLSQSAGYKTYFYSALGASFTWDDTTQQNLVSLIENQKIDQVIFVTKCTNRFFQETYESANAHTFQVNQTLLKLEKTLPFYFLEQSHPMLKIMLLASRHLQKQRKHILKTNVLGKTLRQKGIATASFVYHTDSKVFYTPGMIEKKVLLYGKLSSN